jgi:hypothetical protein
VPTAGVSNPSFIGALRQGSVLFIPPPPLPAWTLGALWIQSIICAKNGLYGIQRTANGSLGSSDVTSTVPFSVTAGASLFASFWVKSSVAADGQIGFGLSFYNAANVLIGSTFVETTNPASQYANWTQVFGNIPVPAFAVTAVPVVRSFSNLHGFWCVDSVFVITSGGNFELSALRHWYSERELFR